MVTVSIIFDRRAERKWETAKEEAEVKRAGRASDGEERTVWGIVAYTKSVLPENGRELFTLPGEVKKKANYQKKGN